MKDISYEINRDSEDIFIIELQKNQSCGAHFHRCFELNYVIDGELTIAVNDNPIVCKKNEIVFIHSFYTHIYRSDAENLSLRFIAPTRLSEDFLRFFEKKTLSPLLNDAKYNRDILLPIINKLSEIKNPNDSPLIIKGYLNVLFGNLIEYYGLSSFDDNSQINTAVEILSYIDRNYNKNLNLEVLSNIFGYNKSYFSRIFNRHAKQNINSYINSVRTQKLLAKYVPNETSITDLVFECGFTSLSTFYRCFNKLTGISPKKYFYKTSD